MRSPFWVHFATKTGRSTFYSKLVLILKRIFNIFIEFSNPILSFPKAIELLANGRLDLARMISHRFDFKDSLEAYETAAAGKGIKIIINVNKA